MKSATTTQTTASWPALTTPVAASRSTLRYSAVTCCHWPTTLLTFRDYSSGRLPSWPTWPPALGISRFLIQRRGISWRAHVFKDSRSKTSVSPARSRTPAIKSSSRGPHRRHFVFFSHLSHLLRDLRFVCQNVDIFHRATGNTVSIKTFKIPQILAAPILVL